MDGALRGGVAPKFWMRQQTLTATITLRASAARRSMTERSADTEARRRPRRKLWTVARFALAGFRLVALVGGALAVGRFPRSRPAGDGCVMPRTCVCVRRMRQVGAVLDAATRAETARGALLITHDPDAAVEVAREVGRVHGAALHVMSMAARHVLRPAAVNLEPAAGPAVDPLDVLRAAHDIQGPAVVVLRDMLRFLGDARGDPARGPPPPILFAYNRSRMSTPSPASQGEVTCRRCARPAHASRRAAPPGRGAVQLAREGWSRRRPSRPRHREALGRTARLAAGCRG